MVTMRIYTGIAAALALLAGMPAIAGVKDGVDAWERGDYRTAVAQWQKDAAKGDVDALYNLAQAYRLGRGVAEDMTQAETLYARAAAGGHPLAADNYGLLLFQKGQRAEALPYLQGAAGRGDPRAEYLLGIAHFNGDLVEKDWVRAYALLTLANGQGLPQAAQAMAQMDQYILLEQRQQGAALATQLQAQADANRAQQLAAADLAQGKGRVTPAVVSPSAGQAPQSLPVAASAPVAQTYLADAMRATGSESPATAGADYARPQAVKAPPPARAAVPTPAPQPKVAAFVPTPSRPAAAPRVAAPAADGPWRVQLGAFSVAGNADQLWKKLGGKGVLAGKKKYLLPSGNLTRLLAGGFASQAEAGSACVALKQGGQSCLVTR